MPRSDDLFRALVEQVKDYAIFSIDTAGRPTTWNEGVRRILGFEENEFVGCDISRKIFTPEDVRAGVPEQELEIAARTGTANNDRWLRRKDGTPFFATGMTTALRDPAGRISGFSKVLRDSTPAKRTEEALRESERRYRTLFDSIDEGFCVVEMVFDEAGKPVDYWFLEVNAAFANQTGLTDAAGRRMRQLAPSHEQHWFDAYGKVAMAGEPVRFEARAEALGRWFDVYAFRVGPPESRRVGVLFKDITERKQNETALEDARVQLRAHAVQLEERIRERTASLETSLNSIEELLYTIAHDLRAPNRAMQGYAELLRIDYGDKLDSTGREYLSRIMEAALRNDQLIRDLLQFGRLSHVDVSLETVDALGAVQNAVREVESAARKHAAHIDVLQDHPWPRVMANETLLREVVVNLLTNAMIYVPADRKPHVVVSATASKKHTVIRIRDNGIGIAAAQQEEIFRPFVRVPNETGAAGTGMGLSIVRKAAERMQATVGVESSPGQGSCFWIALLTASNTGKA